MSWHMSLPSVSWANSVSMNFLLRSLRHFSASSERHFYRMNSGGGGGNKNKKTTAQSHLISFLRMANLTWNLWNSHSLRPQMELAGHRSHPYRRSLHPANIFKDSRIQGSLSSLYGTQQNCVPAAIYLCLQSINGITGKSRGCCVCLAMFMFLKLNKRPYSTLWKHSHPSWDYATSWHEYKLREHFHFSRGEAAQKASALRRQAALNAAVCLCTLFYQFLSPPTLLVLNACSSPTPLQLELRDLLWIVPFSRSLIGLRL